MTSPEAQQHYWYCRRCNEEVGDYHVTYQELHDGCGGQCDSLPITDMPLIQSLEAEIKRLREERSRLLSKK